MPLLLLLLAEPTRAQRALLLLLLLAIAGSRSDKSDGRIGENSTTGSRRAASYHEVGESIAGISLPILERHDDDSVKATKAVFFLPNEREAHLEDAYVSTPIVSEHISFQSDFATMHRRFARLSKASNVTQGGVVSTVPSSIMNITRRYRREDHNACTKFEEGDPIKREFYSPGYPEPYPKNISCFRVLEADPGMVLKVEFRDYFELEDQEKCTYDFLEVRDGKYGYSRLIGKFCRPFPFPEITSSSRYLWLHFQSDNNIQGMGFRAVWSMIPRPPVKTPETEECMLNVTHQNEYIIETAEIADRKKTAVEQGTELDCIWNITVKDGYKIQITFPNFHLDKPNECDINYVQVYDKDPTSINNPSLINNFCGSIADLVTSKGNEAYLRFFATKAAMNSSFEAIMTAIREKEGSKDKGCSEDEFDCQDACIASELRCNTRNNCRYRFDEDADVCNTEKTGLNMNSEHVIIILIVFTILMSGLCFTCIFNCIKKLIHDHRIIKEHLRQSRERRLDELGRKTTPCSIIESCTEVGGNGHHHHHHHGSESPSLEVLTNPKELVSPMTIIDRDYMGERSIRLSLDLSDIHQSNNVSNATQERLQESSEERETRDMGCQTRESIFDSGFVLKPSAHPAFTTFGFQTPMQSSGSRKQSLDYHPSHHYHHHAHPHYHPQQALAHHHHHHHAHHRQVADASLTTPPSEKLTDPSPLSRRCSLCHPHAEPLPAPTYCPRHSATPIVPAPPGWSAHESMYSPEELAALQRLQTPATGSPATAAGSPTDSGRPSPKFSISRQRTVGSGENYGFVFGHEDKEPSEHAIGSGPGTGSTGSQRTIGPKPVKCPQVTDSRFKTEAVIEVDQKRPFSIESTKSAPDVIATH